MNGLAAGYAALTGIWLLLRRFTADRPWWLQFVNDLTPLLLAPSALVLGLCALRGSLLGVLAALVPGSVFLLLYRTRLTRKSSPASHAPRLRLQTLNMLCKPRSIDATVRAIVQTDADIVMLQEVLPEMRGLGPALVERYPHQAMYPARSARGTAVLSKIPFESEGRFRLTADGWYCQDVRIEWAGRPLALFNVHLLRPELKLTPRRDWHPFDSRSRADDVKKLLKHVEVEDHDVVVAGDFNMTDQSRDYRSIAAHLNDAFLDAGSGMGFTYPARSPYAKSWYERHAPAFLRLDHVFYQGRLGATTAFVGPSGDSDHYSVVVELESLGMSGPAEGEG
jgi:vancomycin resistance protein VanJ